MMKINLSKIDKNFFYVNEKCLNGETVFLVTPVIDVKWTKDNLIFRSSLWNNDGELISAGFQKFFNLGENTQLSPIPINLNGASLLEKIDGSLLVISKYKGNLIFRTRGTIDISIHQNSIELEVFKQKYPKVFDTEDQTWDHSLLFEWITPSNRIILNYGTEIDFILVGVIKHSDYSLFSQNALDLLARVLDAKRPKRYQFNSLNELVDTIREMKNIEGVVIYTNDDQSMHKVKSSWYLSLHRMKEGLSSLDKIIDVWLDYKKPTYEEFYQKLHEQFDFEIAEYCKDSLLKICEVAKKANKVLKEIKEHILSIKELTRKDQAIKIISSYKSSKRTGIAFNLLDQKEIDDNQYKLLLQQLLDKGE